MVPGFLQGISFMCFLPYKEWPKKTNKQMFATHPGPFREDTRGRIGTLTNPLADSSSDDSPSDDSPHIPTAVVLWAEKLWNRTNRDEPPAWKPTCSIGPWCLSQNPHLGQQIVTWFWVDLATPNPPGKTKTFEEWHDVILVKRCFTGFPSRGCKS